MILSQFKLFYINIFDTELSYPDDYSHYGDEERCKMIITDGYTLSDLFELFEIPMPSKDEPDKLFEVVGNVVAENDIHHYEPDYWVEFSNVKWQYAPKWLEEIYIIDKS